MSVPGGEPPPPSRRREEAALHSDPSVSGCTAGEAPLTAPEGEEEESKRLKIKEEPCPRRRGSATAAAESRVAEAGNPHACKMGARERRRQPGPPFCEKYRILHLIRRYGGQGGGQHKIKTN